MVEGKIGKGLKVRTLRIVAASRQQLGHQRLRRIGTRLAAKCNTGFRKPVQNIDGASGSIQTNPIGQTSIANGVIRKHQCHALLCCVRLTKINPTTGMVRKPIQPSSVGNQTFDSGRQTGFRILDFTECTDSRGDASIQLRKHHLKGEIDGIEPLGGRVPSLFGSSRAKQLQHRQIKAIPQRSAQSRLLKLHRCKCRGADHQLNILRLKCSLHPLLNHGISQAAHPEGTRC